ncbi:hypothetical protein BGX38DRAFT_1265461 [Terfezia claveryi]|nr:hypothetical protein BGX38DRAFT_1265461 [Terfezia claveryi]
MSNSELAQTAVRNRAIRAILTELEFLAEARIITYDDYKKITALLPDTKTYSGAAFTVTPQLTSTETPKTAKAPASQVVVSQIGATSSPASEKKKTHPETAAPPPSYVSVNEPTVPFDARALHDFGNHAGYQPGDLLFSKGSLIRVRKKESHDWWYGQVLNEQHQPVGEMGLFPKTFVKVEYNEKVVDSKPSLPMRKTGDNMMTSIAHDSGSGRVAPQEEKGKGKLEENGTKFGKKLGNAAIFGAGATIGSKIVGGIF